MRKFLLVMMMCVGLSFSSALAKEYSWSDVSVKHKDEQHAVISFTFHNESDRYYSDLYYIPTLSRSIYDEYFSFLEEYTTFEPVAFSIGANESKILTYDCVFPQNLPQGDYALTIKFYEKDIKLLDNSLVAVLDEVKTAIESKTYVEDLNSWCILVDDVPYSPLTGPTAKKHSKVQAKIAVKLVADEKKVVIPKITQYQRNRIGKVVLDTSGKAIELLPNEETSIILDIPIANEPESYLTEVVLVDENSNQISQMYEFRYVLEGASANILNVDYTPENTVLIGVIGSADTSVLENCEVICNIYDTANQLIFSKTELTTLCYAEEEIELILNDIMIPQDSIFVEVIIKYENKELAYRKNEIILKDVVGKEAIFSDLVGTKYEEAVTMLNGLGIISGYPDGTFRPNNSITRAEFTVIADKIAKLVIEDSSSNFSDIDTHWAKQYITTAAKNSILSGYPDSTFRPNNPVTYAESFTILVNMLGHKNKVNQSNFNWPTNYIIKAEEIELDKNVDVENYSVAATRGDVAIMALNAYLMF